MVRDTTFKERKIRTTQMVRVLKGLYPKPKMALEYSNDWEMLVAVILSAQCTDKRVNLVTAELFKKYRHIEDYANASIVEFEKDVHSTGFYRNKAKNIISAATMVLDTYGGHLPRTIDEMTLIPGVARKTANVVLSNAFGIIEGIAVDTHVKRFVTRFDLSDSRNPVQIEKDLMDLVPKEEWANITHYLINYGRDVCQARPHPCDKHPLTIIYPRAANNWPKSK